MVSIISKIILIMFIYLHKYVLSNADWGPLKLFVYFTDQRNMGMSMKVERSSLDQVKARFAQNKKKLEEKKKDYDLDERLAEQREEVRTYKYEHFFNSRNLAEAIAILGRRNEFNSKDIFRLLSMAKFCMKFKPHRYVRKGKN